MNEPHSVISIGYGRQLFVADNPERKRMEGCAAALQGELHMIVFTRRADGLSVVRGADGLVLHPTNSRFKLCMLFDALWLGRRIVVEAAAAAKPLPLITAQDPFEAGLVGFILARWYRLQLTVQEHADVFSTPYWRAESLGNRVRYWLGKRLLRRADTVRVVAKRMIATMQQLGVTAPITQLPVAIDVAAFAAQASPAPQTGDNFTYLSVARFVPQKNLPLLVRAFAAAYKADPRLRLVLVGQGPEEARVRAEIATQFPPATHPKPPITILPWTDDVPALMQSVDAYALSSNYEGWGRVLIEAMAAKLPIVTTDVGAVGEVVIDATHGLVVPVGDEAALTVALVQLAKPKVYHELKAQLATLDIKTVPGTDFAQYGAAWVSTLTGEAAR